MHEYNLDLSENNYAYQLTSMLDEAFNYPVIDTCSLNQLPQSIHELEFNLEIKNTVSIAKDISHLIIRYFGETHPFSLASKSLDTIHNGFLLGFIDLMFYYQDKYWVLDYKTNKLLDYTSPSDIYAIDNPLIESMAEHHYYLQYLLYLVAIKRHVEQRLGIKDATHLIGGAVYYYVRGIFNDNSNTGTGQGIYSDKSCANMVAELDNLFK